MLQQILDLAEAHMPPARVYDPATGRRFHGHAACRAAFACMMMREAIHGNHSTDFRNVCFEQRDGAIMSLRMPEYHI